MVPSAISLYWYISLFFYYLPGKHQRRGNISPASQGSATSINYYSLLLTSTYRHATILTETPPTQRRSYISLTSQGSATISGLRFRSLVFRANHSCFVSERAKVRFTLLLSGRSFVKSEGSESLKSLLKKERMSKKRCEQFALGHKKGENCQNM